jgi:TMEM175 potassium channel family protein
MLSTAFAETKFRCFSVFAGHGSTWIGRERRTAYFLHGTVLGEGENRVTTETARVEAFSDGVFAIAITLLILEIKIPSAGPTPLSLQLLRQWPSYVSFVISFAFIGIMWMNHHRLFTHIRRCNDGLLVLNLLLLLGVTAVPFPTAVLAAHLRQPGERTAVLLYNGTYVFIAICFNVLWRYASAEKRKLLAADVDRRAVDHITRQYAFGPVFYLACFALAYVSVPASLILNGALACFFALPPHLVEKRHSHSTTA